MSTYHLKSLEEYFVNYRKSISKPEVFWGEIAEEHFLWRKPWTSVCEWDFDKPEIKWFQGAQLNITENCIDRHLLTRGEQTAIIFEPNDPQESAAHITYNQLHEKVCKLANVLKNQGVKKGDRVCIYMPMIPELTYAVLACSRIGAIHSVIDPRIQASATASVHHSARLRAQTYLTASRAFFAEQHSVHEEAVHFLEYQNGAWRVNDMEDLEVVLLAEGVQAHWTQQYFGELPFAPTKGEGLKIRWEGAEIPVALHKNVFLLPDGDGTYQAGSTYAWEGFDEGPSEKARAEILEKLRGWFNQEVEVLDHWTGVRPTMRDRQPVFGWHSELPGLGYLNGLGSRGALTSPLLSDRLWELHSGRTSQKS